MQALISVVSLTKAFLLKFLRISPAMRSNQALDSKKFVAGIFCDLTKAFDSVNHEMLIAKLKFYGVQGIFLKLIASI
jgi:hypothetical protein